MLLIQPFFVIGTNFHEIRIRVYKFPDNFFKPNIGIVLSSTNRRIVHVISVSLAIIAMIVGLTLRYTENEPMLQSGAEQPDVELANYADSVQYEVQELGDPN